MEPSTPQTAQAVNSPITGSVEIDEEATNAVAEEPTTIEARIEEKYRQQFVKDIEKFKAEFTELNKTTMEKVIAEYRKKMEPPSKEDIQKLLDQDYLEFVVKLPFSGHDGTRKERIFTLREQPQAVEKKFLGRVKAVLTPLAEEIANITLNLSRGDAASKLVSIIDSFEPMLDVLAYACSLALNPYGEEEGITEMWVQQNISSTRIMQIVFAQSEVNRMRDFFSLVSRQSR